MGMYPGGNTVRVTPTVVAGETADNDVMFNATEIPNAVSNRGGCSKLTNITIIDNDAEKVDMDLIFMQVQTNFGTADSASNISIANLQASKVIGAVGIDWSDVAVSFSKSSGTASIHTWGSSSADNQVGPILVQAAGGSTSIYFTAIVRDTNNADYSATDDLEFVFHFEYID